MSPKLVVIDTIEGLHSLKKIIESSEYAAYDVETNGLNSTDLVIGFSICVSLDAAYYVVLAKYTNTLEQISDFGYQALAKDILLLLQTKQLLMHNGGFDCMMTESNFKVSLIEALHSDTMLLAHLLDENRSVGLKELAKQMYGNDSTIEAKEMQASVIANGGIWLKDNKEMYKADYKILGKYGAKDAWLTFKLFEDLVLELHEQNLIDFFYEEIMALARGPTYELNTTGIQVDMRALLDLKTTVFAEAAESKAFIYAEINKYIQPKYPGTNKKNTFNIGSNVQLSWLIFGVLGLEFNTLTKNGKSICKALNLKLPYSAPQKRQFIAQCNLMVEQIYQPESIINGKKCKAKKFKEPWSYICVDKTALKKHASKHKWIAKLLEYQKTVKLLNTYIYGIEDRIQYGVIRPSYLQHGTKTGRYASRNPNLQNLPRDDQRIKKCFVSRPGKVFVSADYSQLEPRTFASYSQEPKLLAAFDGKTDFYSVVGMEVFNKSDCTPQKEGSTNAFGVKYKQLRDQSKTIALAAAYGATPPQLAKTTQKSIEDTKQDILQYFESFPGVKKMMLEAHDLAKKQGFVTNQFGRKRRLPEALLISKNYSKIDHWDLPYELRGVLNQACNFRIQSTGASIVNRAAIEFNNICKKARIKCQIVSQIHDELVIECYEKDAEAVATILQTAMETTTLLPGVRLEAIPRITKNLAK
jgi:DNA polymerase I-like protein with 3'-5' exonuclease and polymerase domains